MNPYSTAVSTSGIRQHSLQPTSQSCTVCVCLCVHMCVLSMFTTSLPFVVEMIWIRNRYLVWASYLASVSQVSKSLIILSNDLQPSTNQIPAEWFSSVTSSADWVIILRSLLVSCMPGALQSSLDLQWHLTWYTCCRNDRGRTAGSAAESTFANQSEVI